MDGRLTLVLHPGSDPQPTYWAISRFGDLKDARENLRARENTSLNTVHYITMAGDVPQEIPDAVLAQVENWLHTKNSLGAAIWTGLHSNWREKRKQKFSVEDAVRYLEEVEAAKELAEVTFTRAKDYVRNTPPLVQTAVRKEMRRKGWSDAELPRILFEV